MIKVLQWDTMELLHFALQLLRQHNSHLRQLHLLSQRYGVADALEQAFGPDAVLPLRKALDPDLTLALVVAAPENEVN